MESGQQATGGRRRRATSENLGIALGTYASASAAPYGYTVSLWSAGALLIHFHGAPNVGDVFLFAAGALAGFTVLGWLAQGALRSMQPLETGTHRVVAGVLNWFSVGAAVGAVALLAEVPSLLAWALGSLVATLVYLVLASVQLAFVAGRRTSR